MASRYSANYCYDRAGYFTSKAEKESLKGNYDKAGYYKSKSYQWLQRAKNNKK